MLSVGSCSCCYQRGLFAIGGTVCDKLCSVEAVWSGGRLFVLRRCRRWVEGELLCCTRQKERKHDVLLVGVSGSPPCVVSEEDNNDQLRVPFGHAKSARSSRRLMEKLQVVPVAVGIGLNPRPP